MSMLTHDQWRKHSRIVAIIAITLYMTASPRGIAQNYDASAASRHAIQPIFARGLVTRTKMISGRLEAEFGLNRAHGVRPGQRLLVVRPTAGNAVVDEMQIKIVDDIQAVGACVHWKFVQNGDVVLYQRTLSPGSEAYTGPVDPYAEFAELTFITPPAGEDRSTFNARVVGMPRVGGLDISDVEADVFMANGLPRRINIPATSFKQMRVNGLTLVVDRPKGTLVAAAIRDYRELLRAESEERYRIEIAKAKIASNERIEIAKYAIDAGERVELAKAKIVAEADVQVASINARAAADAYVRVNHGGPGSRNYSLGHLAVGEQAVTSDRSSSSGSWITPKTVGAAMFAGRGMLQFCEAVEPEMVGEVFSSMGSNVDAAQGLMTLIQGLMQAF